MIVKDYQNIHEMLRETVRAHPSKTAYKWFSNRGHPKSVNWNQFYDHNHIKQTSKSLIALGVGKGDKIGIIGYTCYQWVLVDVASISIGACAVGIYESHLPKYIQHVVNHSDSVLIFAKDENQLRKLLVVRKDIPKIKNVVLFEERSTKDDWVLSFDSFLDLGNGVSEETFHSRTAQITSKDPATIVYTSGTTDLPKGVVLTHDNIIFTAQTARNCLGIESSDETFLFLPLAHVFARMCIFVALLMGSTTTFARRIDTVIDDIQKAKPDWFASVPRIYEKIHSKVVTEIEAQGPLVSKIFGWACRIGDQITDYKLTKKPIPLLTKIKYFFAFKLVLKNMYKIFGGRLRFCLSGGAPLDPAVAKFFHSAGVLILEGLGMSENTSFSNVNRPNNYRFGWVGQPGPGIEQKLADDGEIMFRGRNIMKEYYKNRVVTAETLTSDGWLYTGDIGEIDSEGFLKIIGRKKELIITAGGKNVAPAAIEKLMASSKYINQVCVVGDRRKYLTALVTLEPDNVARYAKETGIQFNNTEELIKNEKIIKLIGSEVAQKNRELASFETIKKGNRRS